MADYEKQKRYWNYELWRRERERLVRQEQIRGKDIPNFIMTNGTPQPEKPMPPYPKRKGPNIFQQLIAVAVLLLVLAISSWLRN